MMRNPLRRIKNTLQRKMTQAAFDFFNRSGGVYHLVSRPTRHWAMTDWQMLHAAARQDDPRGADLMRLYSLHFNIMRMEHEGIDGSMAELGVYRGATAAFLHTLAPSRTLYLLDTFGGLPENDLAADPSGESGKTCANTSIELVKERVGEENVVYCPGYFPDTASAIPDRERFALVHLDCDLLVPTRAGLEFFYPRMNAGGLIIVHDYCGTRWPGVAEAVDAFLADKLESPVLLPDAAGTAIIPICGKKIATSFQAGKE